MSDTLTYLDSTVVTAKRQTTPPHNRSRTGYGNKIPTSWQLRIGKRWHRVYGICWSNMPTLYILVGGEKVLLGDYTHELR